MWCFLVKLFGHSLIHTKTTQEDVLQHLQNLSRGSRSGDTRLTRTFFTEATAKRLEATGDITMLTLQHGDLRNHGSKHNVVNDCFRARKMKQVEPGADEIVRNTIAALKGGAQVFGRLCARLLFLSRLVENK